MNQKELFQKLAEKKGMIVSSASLTPMEISQAQASGRMWVDENSLGYVWEPTIKFPTTVEEVEEFEENFPLDIKMPNELNNPKWVLMNKEKAIECTLDYIKNALCVMPIDEIRSVEIINYFKKLK